MDKTSQGLFLFNYFAADDAEVMLELWDYLADWYRVETRLDNSTLFVPLEGERSDYPFINHALECGPAALHAATDVQAELQELLDSQSGG